MKKDLVKIIVTEDGTTREITVSPNDGLQKVEIHRKRINTTVVKFVYNITVKNEGEIAGYATEIKDYIPEGLEFIPEENTQNMSGIKMILFLIVGIAAVIFSSNLIVDSSVNIARALNISERIIGLTIIAFGTSLPELVTCVVAAIKKRSRIRVATLLSLAFIGGSVGGLSAMYLFRHKTNSK